MRTTALLISAVAPLACAVCSDASAQQLGGVFGPLVKEGMKAAQYRGSFVQDDADDSWRTRHVALYQFAINDDLLFRAMGGGSKFEDQDFQPEFIRTDLEWQVSDNKARFPVGFRFSAQMRDGSRAERFGAHFTTQQNWTPNFSTRAIWMTTIEAGDRAIDGARLQSRFQANWTLPASRSFAIEMYNNYGPTDRLGNFSTQKHQIGPVYNFPIADGWSVYSNVLFGASDAAPDAEWRMRLTRRFK